MRVYTRGVEQGLVIGDNVQVNVLEVQADHVRLAIIDPDASPSYREEVLYIPSHHSEQQCSTSAVSVYDSYDDMTFEDEESRLIPMA